MTLAISKVPTVSILEAITGIKSENFCFEFTNMTNVMSSKQDDEMNKVDNQYSNSALFTIASAVTVIAHTSLPGVSNIAFSKIFS
uniref:Uncharacterized protein n=1 Tax=Romanomermis culicivorax TaxID=13658 RepID=A0A915I347_ROMCU